VIKGNVNGGLDVEEQQALLRQFIALVFWGAVLLRANFSVIVSPYKM